MVTRDKIAGAVFLVLGSLLILAAFNVEFWLRHLSFFVLFITLGLMLFGVGAYQFATSRGRADRISQQLEGASALRRLWLPSRYYTAKNLFWQFRLMGIMALLAGAATLFVGILAYHRGL